MSMERGQDYSEETEMERVRQVAEEILGLSFEKVQRSGSQANMVGIQSEEVLFSQRLDSRTFFVQDTRYGEGGGAGVYRGSDKEYFEYSRAILEKMDIPASEIAEESMRREQTQVAEVDQESGEVRLEEVQEGKHITHFSRQVEGLPVWSSSLMLGLTKEKQIGFMQLHWPEIPEEVVREAHKLAYKVEHGWQPPEKQDATVESMEAGIIHSPAVGFIMDIYPAIRVIYASLDKSYGRKLVLYLDRHGNNVPLPRQADLPVEAPQERESQPEGAVFRYVVKFVCGSFDNGILARGKYFTAINVYNPTDDKISFRKRFVLTGEKPETGGPSSQFFPAELGPNQAMEIDCRDIFDHTHNLPGTPPDYRKGFVVILSRVELDVVTVYSASGLFGQVKTMDVEREWGKKV